MVKTLFNDDDYVIVDYPSTSSTPHPASKTNTISTSTKTDYLDSISSIIDSLSPVLRPLNLSIHDHPELGYKEHHAHKVLTEFLINRPGWVVTSHAYNIETAFVAVYATQREGSVVSFNVEYDALPGIGHACGHNLIAMASLSAALATQAMMEKEKLGGKVVVFGTPAEEGGGGKTKLLKAGAYAYEKVDINLISHPGITQDGALMRTAAYTSFFVEYFGKEAHAAAAPWEGINALDALMTAYTALSVLRQQTQPGDIIQGNITHGGVKPNIIHAYAAGQFVVRSTTAARRDALKLRVDKCFQAGSLATGARLKVTPTGSYDDLMPNWALGARYREHFNALGGKIEFAELDYEHGATQASSDQGDISHAMPTISPAFWIRSEGPDGEQLGGPHTPDFAAAARRKEAHDKAMMVGKALAGTAVDILSVEGLLEEVKKEYEETKRKSDGMCVDDDDVLRSTYV
ncbi:hypothetical protein AAFC00_006802 [Neodothiora populina]|uniref:Peptidase M20 domain-containing protein 2 n=1 Tax=Neodothiora populina TaxID=2781224 RepID=A0ABR3PCI0_9PEZI